jgi:cytoskeletal protein CcmA (bactofilin family)
MAFGEKRPVKESSANTLNVIELNAEMNGTLSFKEPVDLRINGLFTGKLDVRGSLTVGLKASVESDVTGDYVVIAGKVKGNVHATKLLTLMPTAVLLGDIFAPKLNVVEGAVFEGKCHMTLNEVPAGEWFGMRELSTYLEIEEGVIWELVNSGKIPHVREGDGVKFERVQIDHWAATGAMK